MVVKAYRTLADLQSIVDNAIPEGVSLEYKASELIASRRVDGLCKAVTALANSAGGQFVIGVNAKSGVPVGLDGGVPGPSQRDWIFQIINNQTYPPVESLEVFEVPKVGGTYYVIDVSASGRAPHQFNGRYYKRRGPHSEPMEHYEIEDVRNRPKQNCLPLRTEIAISQEVLLLLSIKNEHPTETLTNLCFTFAPTFKLERSGLGGLADRGLRSLRPSTGVSYFLGSAITILRESPDAMLTVRAEFDFLGRRVVETSQLHIGDLRGTARMRSPEVEALKKLNESTEKLVSELARIRQTNEQLLRMVDGSGLRLSHRTLSAFGKTAKYSPTEIDAAGYQVILNISHQDAQRLERVFHGWSDDVRADYEALSPELRAKFETAFRVEF